MKDRLGSLSPGLVPIWIADELDNVTTLTYSNILPVLRYQYKGRYI